MLNEQSTDSIASLVNLINQNFKQSSSSDEERGKQYTKVNFLIDDLLTKCDQTFSQQSGENIKPTDKLRAATKTKITTTRPAEDFKQELEQEIFTSYRNLEAQLASIGPEINRRVWKYKWSFITVLLIYFILSVLLIVKFGWNTMEPLVWIGGSALVVTNYIILAYYGKSKDPLEFFRVKEQQIRDELYLKYGYSKQRFEQLETRMAQLNSFKNK